MIATNVDEEKDVDAINSDMQKEVVEGMIEYIVIYDLHILLDETVTLDHGAKKSNALCL